MISIIKQGWINSSSKNRQARKGNVLIYGQLSHRKLTENENNILDLMTDCEQKRFWIPSATLQEAFWIWQLTYRKNVELLWKNSKNSIMHSQDKRSIFVGMWAEDASSCFERVLQLLWVLTAFIGQVTGGLWVLCLLKEISFRVKHVYGYWNCRNKHFLCRWQYLASGNKKKNPFLRIHNRAFVQIVVSISPLGSFCNMFVFSW